MHARATAKPLCVSKRVKASTKLIHPWAFRIWPPIDQKVIFEHFLLNFNLRPTFEGIGARNNSNSNSNSNNNSNSNSNSNNNKMEEVKMIIVIIIIKWRRYTNNHQ